MAGTTLHGFPYPADADPVKDGASKARDLTTFLENNVGITKVNAETVNITALNADIVKGVVFATPFPVGVSPVVCTTGVTGGTLTLTTSVTNVTRTGFTLVARRTAPGTTGNCTVNWIAHG